MTGTSGTSSLRVVPARGAFVTNSPAVDSLRRRLQGSLPYGAITRIAHRLGRAERVVYAQVEGEHPLSVSVVAEALRELPDAAVLVALGELLAPARLGVYRLGAEPPEGAPLAALARVAAEIGDVARETLAAYADGAVTAAERAALLTEIDEAAAALTRLRAVVIGSAA